MNIVHTLLLFKWFVCFLLVGNYLHPNSEVYFNCTYNRHLLACVLLWSVFRTFEWVQLNPFYVRMYVNSPELFTNRNLIRFQKVALLGVNLVSNFSKMSLVLSSSLSLAASWKTFQDIHRTNQINRNGLVSLVYFKKNLPEHSHRRVWISKNLWKPVDHIILYH